jgi:hypothetical protein
MAGLGSALAMVLRESLAQARHPFPEVERTGAFAES